MAETNLMTEGRWKVRLENREAALSIAQRELREELENVFPVGRIVRFFMSSRQAIPSKGVVSEHLSKQYAGYVAVRMATGVIRHVHWGNVIGLESA